MKKLQSFFSSFLLVLTLALMVGCTKETIPPATYTTFMDEGMLGFEYKASSYWVYENDSTNVWDSVTVVSTSSGTVESAPVTGYSAAYSEYHQVDYLSYLDGSRYSDYVAGTHVLRNGNLIGLDGQPIFRLNDSLNVASQGLETVEILDSIRLGNNTFHDVVKVKITAGQQIQPVFQHDTFFYISKTAGILKKQYDLGGGQFESWTLMRWHVKR